jgi:fructoselysine-6-phosphate deglycase
VIDRDTSVILIKGEDITRTQMDRVEKFVHTVCKKVTVFDTKEFVLEGISEKYRGILSPIVMRSAFMRVSIHLEEQRKHPLAIRRYYRRLDY